MSAPLMIWGITDGSAGMVSQVSGIGEALAEKTNGTFTLKTCRRRKPWCWLPGNIHAGALAQLTPDSDALTLPWPDVVLTSGRRSAALVLAIKRASGGKTLAVHLQDPRISPHHFDLVVPMEHDHMAGGENILPTRFALHRLTKARLQTAGEQWGAEFAHYPEPRIVVLIGGSTNKYTLTERAMRVVVQQLLSVLSPSSVIPPNGGIRSDCNAIRTNAKSICAQTPQQVRGDIALQAGSLLVTTSRRTGAGNTALLKQALAENEDGRVFFYDGEGENPYLGMLMLADAIIVTNDSVSMMSEAAYIGKPLYILPLAGHRDTKPARFAEMLVTEGIARPLTLPLERWEYTIPDEREKVVAAILQRVA